MYVYRIEHKETHDGPYRRSWDVGNDMRLAHNDDAHPGMYQEFSVDRSYDLYCACATVDKIVQWFDGWLERLRDNGYVVARYDAKVVMHGSVQSIFYMSSAIRVEEFPIDILLYDHS